MDDKKLYALLEAVRSGSLSKAASELGYTQSGLTQMMNSLEDELGCCLLVRGYNGIKLTTAGEQLLPFIEDASASMKRLKDEARLSSAGQGKPIRIGVFPSITKSWLPYILKEYQKKCPGTSIEITVGNIEMQDWLDKDNVDLVLGEESMVNTGVSADCTPLAAELSSGFSGGSFSAAFAGGADSGAAPEPAALLLSSTVGGTAAFVPDGCGAAAAVVSVASGC